jgi:hypothetical protein
MTQTADASKHYRPTSSAPRFVSETAAAADPQSRRDLHRSSSTADWIIPPTVASIPAIPETVVYEGQ